MSETLDIDRYDQLFRLTNEGNLLKFIEVLETGKFNFSEHLLLQAISRRKPKLFHFLSTRVFDLKNLQDPDVRDSLLWSAINLDDLNVFEYLLNHLWILSELTDESAKPIANSLRYVLASNAKEMRNMIALLLQKGWKIRWQPSDVSYVARLYPLEICQPIFEATNPAELPSDLFYSLLKWSSEENLLWIRNHWDIHYPLEKFSGS